MERNNIPDIKSKEKRWCILCHPDSDLIGEIFSGKRQVSSATDDHDCPMPPFEYFIPFEDLKLRQRRKTGDTEEDDFKDYDAMLDERALRSDLHHFIFICKPKDKVRKILNSPWSRALSHRIFAYRDEHGDPVEISNTEMERFKTVIKRYDFQIVNGEPSDEVREGDQVTVISGPMAGSDGMVKEIREREGLVLLTIVFSMFQDRMCIAVPGISLADVRLKSAEAQELIQDPVIGHFEDELIELLSHLHGRKGTRELNKEDQKRLKFLYQYSDIVFEDNEANRAKFAALMLICAYLMNDKKEVRRRTKQVEALLASLPVPSASPEGPSIPPSTTPAASPAGSSTVPSASPEGPSSALSCYLLTALFIVTHNPKLRKQVKTWRQSHPDCPLSIRRFHSIAKQIRC